MANLATVELDRAWLRRIRGKLDADEIQKAKDLADDSIKSWIRELYGAESDDEDLETILDADDETLDVAAEVIADLYHENPPGTLDNKDHEYYKPFVHLADMIASYHLVQWGDFMGKSEDSGDSPQDRVISANINRIKSEIISIGFVVTVAGDRRHFQRSSIKKDGCTFRRSARR